MTKPIIAALLASVLVGKNGYPAERFRLEKVWETNVERLTHERNPPGGHPVHSISFSPDGRWISAVIDDHGPKSTVKSHLLILDLMRPENDPINVDLPHVPLPFNEVLELSWSPRSDLILASHTLVNLSGTVVCSLPEETVWSRFMSGDKIVSLKPKPYRRAFTNSSDFLFFDQTCSAQEPWEIQGRWLLSSVNPDTGSALVASMTGNQEAKLVDLNSRTMGAPIGAGDSDLGGMPLFANEGKSACKPGGLEGNRYSQAVCFDIASGKLLGKAPVNGGGPMATAAHSSRVVLTDWRYQPYIIMDGGFEILRKRIVWDFETKEEIVSWGSGNQRYYQWHAREENTWGKKPFAVAFSADGTLVAEGGDGLIRLYRIQPAQSR